MHNYYKLYKEFYTKYAAESDIEAAKKLIEGNTPVDSPQSMKNPYSEYGKAVSRHTLPKPSDYNAAPLTKSLVKNTVTKPAQQNNTSVKMEPEIQTLPNTNIKYRQYAENDQRVKKYQKRLRRMGFARFDENGPWIATPHGTSIMRQLPKGLDRGVIQEMLAEGKVPVGVFEAATLAAQQLKASQQIANPANTSRQRVPSLNVVQQTYLKVPAARQIMPSSNTLPRRASKRRAPTVEEALKMRHERIVNEAYRKHPVLAQIRDLDLRWKAIKDKLERERQVHLPEFFPFGDINNYYNKPTTLNTTYLYPRIKDYYV